MQELHVDAFGRRDEEESEFPSGPKLYVVVIVCCLVGVLLYLKDIASRFVYRNAMRLGSLFW